MKLFKTQKDIKAKLAKLDAEFNEKAEANADAYLNKEVDLEGFYSRNEEILNETNNKELFTAKELDHTKNVNMIKGALLASAGAVIATVVMNIK